MVKSGRSASKTRTQILVPCLLSLLCTVSLQQLVVGENLKRSHNTQSRYLYSNPITSLPVIEYKQQPKLASSSKHHKDGAALHVVEGSNSDVLFDEKKNYDYIPTLDPLEYRVIQFYDSNVRKCTDCEYFKEHYVKLATRVNEIVQSSLKSTTNNRASISGMLVKVSFYSISCSHNLELCKKQTPSGNDKFPIIRLYPAADSKNKEVVDNGFDIAYKTIHPFQVIERLGIRTKIQEGEDSNHAELEEHWSVGHSIDQKKKLSATMHQAKHHHNGRGGAKNSSALTSRTKNEIEYDVNRVIDNFLRNYVHQPLSENDQSTHGEEGRRYYGMNHESQLILREFLFLLHKTLPQSWKIHSLIKDVIENMSYVAHDRNYLVTLIQEHKDDGRLPMRNEWSTYCTEYNKKFQIGVSSGDSDEEYTCGFWEMLHAVGIGLVEYNKLAFDGSVRIRTYTTIEIMRLVLQLFRGAGFDLVSSSTLQYMYKTCARDSCNRLSFIPGAGDESDWIELPLWFNEMQNYMNVQMIKRVAYDTKKAITLQDETDVQFPSMHDCPTCWEEHHDGHHGGIELIKRNNEMIYKFLKIQYGPQDDEKLLTTLKEELLAHQPSSKFYGKHSNNSSNGHERSNSHKKSGAGPKIQVHSSSLAIIAFFGVLFRSMMYYHQGTLETRKRKLSQSSLYDMEEYMHSKLS